MTRTAFFVSLIILFFASCGSVTGLETVREKISFTVYGNCNLCKETIEGAVDDLEGVYWSVWNVLTKQITVKYDSSLLSLDRIKREIAEVGYDSDEHRAEDDKYNSLNGCCKYKRP